MAPVVAVSGVVDVDRIDSAGNHRRRAVQTQGSRKEPLVVRRDRLSRRKCVTKDRVVVRIQDADLSGMLHSLGEAATGLDHEHRNSGRHQADLADCWTTFPSQIIDRLQGDPASERMRQEVDDAQGGHRPQVLRQTWRSLLRRADCPWVDEKIHEVKETPCSITRPEQVSEYRL